MFGLIKPQSQGDKTWRRFSLGQSSPGVTGCGLIQVLGRGLSMEPWETPAKPVLTSELHSHRKGGDGSSVPGICSSCSPPAGENPPQIAFCKARWRFNV